VEVQVFVGAGASLLTLMFVITFQQNPPWLKMGVCVLGDRAFDQGLALTGRERAIARWETITFDSGVGATRLHQLTTVSV